jgi:ribosome-associated protein
VAAANSPQIEVLRRMTDDHSAAEQPLRLDQFLKMQCIAETGGHAKLLIQGGEVKLNGEVETRRRKKLSQGDLVEVFGETYRVAW